MKYIKTLSLAALAVLAVACKSDDKAGTAQQAKPQVKIAKVTSEDIPQTEPYTATVESDVKSYRENLCRCRRQCSSGSSARAAGCQQPAAVEIAGGEPED